MPRSSSTSTNRPLTYDHLKKKKPIERVVSVCLDGDAAEALREATAELARIELAGGDTATAKTVHNAAQIAAKQSTVNARFRSIGRKRYDELVRDHPPTPEALEENDSAPYDAATFSVALVAASCVEPVMSEEQVQELADEWNLAEFMPLWVAAVEVNTQRRVVELGKGPGATRS